MIADPKDQTRKCPRCQRDIERERFRGTEGRMTLWRCECGWCNVVAESGMVSRPRVEEFEREAKDRSAPTKDDDDSPSRRTHF